MDLQRGFPLLLQQFKALFSKNLLLAWRSKGATLLQLFSSFFFIFLLFMINLVRKTQINSTAASKNLLDPDPLVSLSIPPCEEKFSIKKPCFDFVWSGNDNEKIGKIVKAIMANNPGRLIPDDKVKSFQTMEEVDKWLFDNQQQVPGAIHFKERTPTIISYGLQTNSTLVQERGEYEDPTFKFQIPLQIAVEREIARSFIGDPNFSWSVSFKQFAHPAIESIFMFSILGPTFFLATATFNFVFQISHLVLEKELKLRQMMTMMGLIDTAYWLSWLTWEGIMTFLSSFFIVLFGVMFQLDFFLKNDFPIVFLLFFLFELDLVGFAFMLSAFVGKSSSATTVGFLIFIIGFFMQIVVLAGYPYKPGVSSFVQNLWSLFPPNLLAKGVEILSDATALPKDKGVRWSERGTCFKNEPEEDVECVVTMDYIYKWFLIGFLLWFVLAIYFDNIIPNASSARKPIYYFLTPSYWTGKGGNIKGGSSISHDGNIAPDDEDVLEEENIVKQQTREGEVDPTVAVQIRGLVKAYPGSIRLKCCAICCFKCEKTSPYTAVKGLWVNFAKDQLFCLLGPNGAGKTTTIGCLTGVVQVSDGDTLIYGHSIRNSVGISNIRRIIGVCPQFDILWDALSCQEHLDLFANIKGLPPSSIKLVVQKLLAEVQLTKASKVRAVRCSGGMKRRLSVAGALLGDPKLVILDEPTTGMDPITRRHVWDIIETAKKGRAIVLTTHSMEEADILSDRIGIMAKGKLRCIGTAIRLKSRFGTGFVTNISFTANNTAISPFEGLDTTTNHESVKQFFKRHLDVEATEETKAFLTFVIPHDREKQLTKFFTELQGRKREFGIADIQLGLSTLEEVFLNIARQAELETAGEEQVLTFTSEDPLNIPVGDPKN